MKPYYDESLFDPTSEKIAQRERIADFVFYVFLACIIGPGLCILGAMAVLSLTGQIHPIWEVIK